MRFEIRSLQQRIGITAVYVTHSQDEALVLSDQIAVMRDGVIEQRGAPLDIYNVPRTEFVATFIGLANILAIDEVQPGDDVFSGRYRERARDRRAGGSDRDGNACRDVRSAKLCVRPVDIRIGVETRTPSMRHRRAEPDRRNRSAVTFTGGLVDYFVAPDGAADASFAFKATPPITANQGDRVVARFRRRPHRRRSRPDPHRRS